MESRKPISHFIAGLIIAGIMVVYSCLLYLLGQGQNAGLGFISYAILCLALIFFISQYGKAKNHQVTFGGLFSYGFKATAIATLIVILFTIAFLLAVPEVKEKSLEEMRIQLEKDGKMSDSEINDVVSMTERFYLVAACGGVLIVYLIVGAIGSLIGAGVTKKNPVNPLDQLDM